uniref:NADH-ubiquinone oxidoreductase chain 6 n=1 Tax=Nothybus sumatranus TaxID=1820051 RepID=A0A8A5M2F4_9DIOP|nr:NADH dehydrogenase subunit 6 [Nothybus sumatranus]QTF87887.1 NADH dehydrogenase subunit 6 [Nothybus sumatranus]
MLQVTLYTILLIIAGIFSQMTHPLTMGLTLLLQTMIISLTLGMMMETFWFSYILFLIFIGGMLVLFIYVTSLASNEMFSISMKTLMLSTLLLLFSILFIFITDKSMMSINWMNIESFPLDNLSKMIPENSLSLNKLYNYPTNMITFILMNYLLITLITVVKITNLFYGPLRSMN